MAVAKKPPTKKPSRWAQWRQNRTKKSLEKSKMKRAALEEKMRLGKDKLAKEEIRTEADQAIIEKRKANKVRLSAMADKAAATLPKFVEVCNANGLDPKETFLKHYPILSNNAAIIQKQVIASFEAKEKNQGFSETVFYANIITRMLLKKKKTEP